MDHNLNFSIQCSIADAMYEKYKEMGIDCFFVYSNNEKTIKFFEVGSNKEIAVLIY